MIFKWSLVMDGKKVIFLLLLSNSIYAASRLSQFIPRIQQFVKHSWQDAQQNKEKLVAAGLGWGAGTGLWYAGRNEIKNYNPETDIAHPLTLEQLDSLGIPQNQKIGYVQSAKPWQEDLKMLDNLDYNALGNEVIKAIAPSHPYVTREGKFLIPETLAEVASTGNQEALSLIKDYYTQEVEKQNLGYDANTAIMCGVNTAAVTALCMLNPVIQLVGRAAALASSYGLSAAGNTAIVSSRNK